MQIEEGTVNDLPALVRRNPTTNTVEAVILPKEGYGLIKTTSQGIVGAYNSWNGREVELKWNEVPVEWVKIFRRAE